MTWGAEQKTARDKIRVKARKTTRQSLKEYGNIKLLTKIICVLIITIIIDDISDLSITMAAYFHSPATPPSSSSFLILFEITATSL